MILKVVFVEILNSLMNLKESKDLFLRVWKLFYLLRDVINDLFDCFKFLRLVFLILVLVLIDFVVCSI